MSALLGKAIDAIGQAGNKLGLDLPISNKSVNIPAIEQEFSRRLPESDKELWYVNGQDWYKVFGYQFVIIKRTPRHITKNPVAAASGFIGAVKDFFSPKQNKAQAKTGVWTYTLPIPPQQMLVKPIMANRITPTIGGVVEEVSSVTFWMISLSGTTGTAIGRSGNTEDGFANIASKFRQNISTTGLLSGIAAQANSILNKAGNFTDQVSSGNTGGVIGAVNNALTPGLPYSGSGVDPESNGFVEIQNLQKFLYVYQKLKFTYPNEYDLYFISHKTRQKWKIAVKDGPSIQQSMQNPHLYRYQIQLQGWDLTDSSLSSDQVEFDRFGPGGDLKEVNTTNVFDTVDKVKSIGKNIFG